MKVLNEYSKVLTICEKRFFVNVIESACNFYITIKRADTEEILVDKNKFSKRDYFEGSAIFAAFRVDYSVINYIENLPFEDFQQIVYNNFAAFESIANQEAEEAAEAAEESADKAESAADAAETYSGDAEAFAAKVTTAADAKEAAKYQEAAAVAADMAESFADKAESFADAAAAFAAKVTTAADAETKKAAEISANRAAKAADMATKAAEEARRAANQAAAEAFAAFAAPESGEARKADILAKLAAAYDTTKNKSIAITLNNYIHTAEGIAAEEFTKALYYWYIGALLRFGFNLEAAAPESVRAAEESETAAEYQEAAAPESGEAAADLLKMAAAVAFGFVGFYVTFAIFGV